LVHDLDTTCSIANEVTERPGFDQLACARGGQVVAVDGSAYFNRPGPRIVDGLEILAQVLAVEAGATLRAGARWLQPPRAASARNGERRTWPVLSVRRRHSTRRSTWAWNAVPPLSWVTTGLGWLPLCTSQSPQYTWPTSSIAWLVEKLTV
jgi:hypothetical protein